MKTKLFNALKQDHKDLGLSDEVLQAYAESLASTGLITDENLATVSKGQASALKSFQKKIDQERTERAKKEKELDDYKKEHPEDGGTQKKKEEPDDIDQRIAAAIAKSLKPLVDKQSESEAKTKSEARKAMILSKAKELKISQQRIDEGFAISDDMDDAGIETYLSKVAQNDVARSLPKEGDGFGISTSDKMLEEIAAASVQNLPDVKP